MDRKDYTIEFHVVTDGPACEANLICKLRVDKDGERTLHIPNNPEFPDFVEFPPFMEEEYNNEDEE